MAPITRSGDWYRVLERYFAQDGTMEEREPAYECLTAQQGFEPDLPPELLEALQEKGLEVGSLGQLIEATFAQGFRSLQFHSKGYVWIEKEPEAYRGEGKPGEALGKALLEAPKERVIP
jgi:hypothetical protein